MDKLTKKQQGFVKDYIETDNATEAIINNYPNVKDRIVAKSMGSENLAKPYIKEAIESLADRIPDELITEKHLALLNKVDKEGNIDVQAVSKGLDMGYKIKGAYSDEAIKPPVVLMPVLVQFLKDDTNNNRNTD